MALADSLSEMMVKNLGFKPTRGQEEMFTTLSRFLAKSSKEHYLLVISGYAGTGKTSAIAALISLLKSIKYNYVLLAPTGRAAKVLSNITGEKAQTIHKHIYRQKSLRDGRAEFSIDFNKAKNTVYIVDEVSLISSGGESDSIFGTGDLLSDLLVFVRNNPTNRLILTGDPAQLPPVGMDCSPALDLDYLRQLVPNVESVTLSDVVRQAQGSGILVNATHLREDIEGGVLDPPHFLLKKFVDIQSINGEYLIEAIADAIAKYGETEVVVLCRSNARANKYNSGIRAQVLFREERLSRGDRVMVVKNCYQFKGQGTELDFIANGDVAELVAISDYKEVYGLHFAKATLSFPDYNGAEVEARIILDTLETTTPALSQEQQRALFLAVAEDYSHILQKRKRYEAVRNDSYYNALQIKYSSAITGHKSQGGQWKCVFVDNILWRDEITLEDKKWLYTALTRATERVYLVNYDQKFTDLDK